MKFYQIRIQKCFPISYWNFVSFKSIFYQTQNFFQFNIFQIKFRKYLFWIWNSLIKYCIPLFIPYTIYCGYVQSPERLERDWLFMTPKYVCPYVSLVFLCSIYSSQSFKIFRWNLIHWRVVAKVRKRLQIIRGGQL